MADGAAKPVEEPQAKPEPQLEEDDEFEEFDTEGEAGVSAEGQPVGALRPHSAVSEPLAGFQLSACTSSTTHMHWSKWQQSVHELPICIRQSM